MSDAEHETMLCGGISIKGRVASCQGNYWGRNATTAAGPQLIGLDTSHAINTNVDPMWHVQHKIRFEVILRGG